MTVDVANPPERVVDDADLAEAARDDYEAFEQLYRRYATRVYRYCYTHTRNAQDAEDVTAQTFVAALEGIARYRGRSTFAAWLFGIAWRKCKDYQRGLYRRREEDLALARDVPDPNAVNLERHARDKEILHCVRQIWPMLSEDRQEALRLRFWGGLSTKETAAVMGRSRGAVKMLVSRAIADLRERCLDAEQG